MKLQIAQAEERPGAELAPLIDVIFLVLVAFIQASVFAQPATVLPIRLPGALTGAAEEPVAVRIVIDAEGAIFYEDHPSSPTAIRQLLQDRMQDDPGLSVSIFADSEVELGRFVEVMDAARRAGVTNLSVATERPRDRPAP